jgi:hypothetical protein
MKNFEARISSLERKMLPQLQDKSIVFATIGSNVFRIDRNDYTKPEGVADKEFLDSLLQKGIIAPNRVVVYTIKPDDDGL